MNSLSFEDGNGLRLCRVRIQSILSLTSFIVINALTASAHVPVQHARRLHRPAVRRLYLEGAHEPMTITQHPLRHPLVGPPTVIIKVTRRACAVSSASAHETRRWKFRRYTYDLAADQ